MGVFAILSKEIWCFRAQRKYEEILLRQDEDALMELIREGIERAVKGGLRRREWFYFNRAASADPHEVFIRLMGAFHRGSNRDPKLPQNLSNALDEVIREAATIAGEAKSR